MQYYNIPPQNNPGDYERLVRQHFDLAINVDHYLHIWDGEYQELQILEKKAQLQETLHNLMLHETNLRRILEISPYSDVRKEAYNFIQSKVEPVSALEYPFQRNLMYASMDSFIHQLDVGDPRQSLIYREFYSYFTDEDFRRANGLPLP